MEFDAVQLSVHGGNDGGRGSVAMGKTIARLIFPAGAQQAAISERDHPSFLRTR